MQVVHVVGYGVGSLGSVGKATYKTLGHIGAYLKSMIYPRTEKRVFSGTPTGVTSATIVTVLESYKKIHVRYKANATLLMFEQEQLEAINGILTQLRAHESTDDYLTEWIAMLSERQTQITNNVRLLTDNQALYNNYKKDFANKTKSVSADDDEYWRCSICEENRKNRVIGCGHVFCDVCLERLIVCPICKVRIVREKIIPVYL